MKKIIVSLLLLILFSYAFGTDFGFKVESPQITSKYPDYDIRMLSCNFTSNATIILQVWGNINVHPAKGYLKEYDVNITDNYGDYVHLFLMSDNGSEPVSFAIISQRVKIINYSINGSNLIWNLSGSIFENISGEIKVKAYAGIIDLSKNEYLFLDNVEYPRPPPPKENSFPYWLFIPILGAVIAIVLYVYLRRRK